MRINDAITGAVLVIFAVAEIAYTRTFPSLHGQSYGPNLFPALIGLALAMCGLVLIIRGLIARRTTGQAIVNDAVNTTAVKWIDLGNIAESNHARINALLIIVFLLVYIFLSDWLGFIPLSLIIVAVMLHRLGSPLVVACSVAIVTTAVIQILFAKVLLVPLPAGLLQGIVW